MRGSPRMADWTPRASKTLTCTACLDASADSGQGRARHSPKSALSFTSRTTLVCALAAPKTTSTYGQRLALDPLAVRTRPPVRSPSRYCGEPRLATDRISTWSSLPFGTSDATGASGAAALIAADKTGQAGSPSAVFCASSSSMHNAKFVARNSFAATTKSSVQMSVNVSPPICCGIAPDLNMQYAFQKDARGRASRSSSSRCA
mmetsp:Transcript_86350/g.252703  ORF Transcript_86350/g.252703 Transcript_86350/m.252703 type:complete len:204 (-) Transcript_86350:922-1533(-)